MQWSRSARFNIIACMRADLVKFLTFMTFSGIMMFACILLTLYIHHYHLSFRSSFSMELIELDLKKSISLLLAI